MIRRYEYGSHVVEIDAEAWDGVLLAPPAHLDVAEPFGALDTPEGYLPDGTPYVTALSMHEREWNEAVAALYSAGFGLGNDGEPIGERDGMTAYAIVSLSG